jgi:hypothetical protein
VRPFKVVHEAEASHYRLALLGGDSLRESAIGITSFLISLSNVIPMESE